MKRSIFFLVLATIYMGCGGNTLSTEEAATIISADYPTYCTSGHYDRITKNISGYNIDDGEVIHGTFKNLELQKLAKVKSGLRGSGYQAHYYYTLHLTEKGKALYDGKFALTTNEFDSILGIAQDGNTARVNYAMKSVATPFFRLQGTKRIRCKETTWEEEVTLVKYDTGWKIQQDKEKSILGD